MTPDTHPDCNLRARKLHERYLGSFLIVIIIGLVSVQWTEVPKLIEYLNFALALASLLLAGLAIVQAMTSTSNMDQSIAALGGRTDDINEVATKLSIAAGSVESEIKKIVEMGPQWTSGLAKTQTQLEEIRQLTLAKAVAGSTPEIEPVAEPVAPVAEALLPLAAKPGQPIIVEPPPQPISGAAFDLFFRRSSKLGKYLLYSAAICAERERPLDLKEIAAAVKGDVEYFWGFMVATLAAGYMEHKGVEGHSVRYTITKFPGATSIDLRRKFLARATKETDNIALVALDTILAQPTIDKPGVATAANPTAASLLS